jgi:hypothetical protein
VTVPVALAMAVAAAAAAVAVAMEVVLAVAVAAHTSSQVAFHYTNTHEKLINDKHSSLLLT